MQTLEHPENKKPGRRSHETRPYLQVVLLQAAQTLASMAAASVVPPGGGSGGAAWSPLGGGVPGAPGDGGAPSGGGGIGGASPRPQILAQYGPGDTKKGRDFHRIVLLLWS